jgi:hypothetical protein
MNDFSLQIKNPYYYKKKFAIALLHFTAGFLLLDAWYESSAGSASWLGIIFLVIAFFEVIYAFFAFKLMHRYPLLNSVVRLVTACAFLVYSCLLFYRQQYLFGIFMAFITFAFVMIFFIERRWAKPFIVHINEDGILFPGTFKKPLIKWKDLNYVILRNSVLTLDMRSNRVIQLEIYEEPKEQQLQTFNAFCSAKIEEHK